MRKVVALPAHTIVDDIVRESRDPELDRKFAEACVCLDRYLDALQAINLHDPAMAQEMTLVMESTRTTVERLRKARKRVRACGC